nr:polysaccharide biosynthesis/export family protein [Acinetobacter lwoffii]
MEPHVRQIQLAFFLTYGLALTGCAVTSGLQTYDLPVEGVYQTELGTSVNVIKLTQDSMLAVQPAVHNIQQDYAHLFSTPHRHYSLSPGDILSISLWAYPEISGSEGYQIDQRGSINFPMIGHYKAAGKSLTQVNRELRNQLSRYLKTPDVIVRVLSYQGKYYSIQGSAGKGGIYYLTDQPVSLYSALGMAGGIGDNASINLIRQGRNYSLNTIELEKAGYSLHNLLIQPNDTIYVNARENHKIYVMGESGKNQALQMRVEEMSLTDVLGESLGINPFTASRSKIYILRSQQNQKMTQIYQLDLSNIGDFGLASQFKMRSNDIVYVDTTGLVRWQRIINQILPLSNTFLGFERLGQ